jgi:hypothetical protein
MNTAHHLELLRRNRTNDAILEELGVTGRGAERILDVVCYAAKQRCTRFARLNNMRPLIFSETREAQRATLGPHHDHDRDQCDRR